MEELLISFHMFLNLCLSGFFDLQECVNCLFKGSVHVKFGDILTLRDNELGSIYTLGLAKFHFEVGSKIVKLVGQV